MKSGLKWSAWVTEIIIGCYVFLFVYAATSKVTEYDKFRIQLGQSSIMEPLAPVIAWIIPCLELLLSFFLVFRRFRLEAMYGSVSLMVLFSMYIIYVTEFSPHVPCSCGGILETMGWTEHLVFNVAFVVLGVTNILIMEQPPARMVQS